MNESIKVTRLDEAEPRPRHVAIGTFDGVHVGHRAVIGDAYCEELRRTAVGDLGIDDAGSDVLPPERLVAHLPERELTHEQALDVVHGIKLEASGEEGPGPLRLTTEGRLLAIARPQGKVLKTEVVLA